MTQRAAAPPSDPLPPDLSGRLRLDLAIEFPSDVSFIEPVVGLVQRQCAESGFSARQVALNVPVALSEALSNAILRGNREDPAKSVRLRCAVDRGALVLDVGDEGPGFDMSHVADPLLPANLERENGRGIFLMRKLMDGVEQFADRGNVVRLTLRRA